MLLTGITMHDTARMVRHAINFLTCYSRSLVHEGQYAKSGNSPPLRAKITFYIFKQKLTMQLKNLKLTRTNIPNMRLLGSKIRSNTSYIPCYFITAFHILKLHC